MAPSPSRPPSRRSALPWGAAAALAVALVAACGGDDGPSGDPGGSGAGAGTGGAAAGGGGAGPGAGGSGNGGNGAGGNGTGGGPVKEPTCGSPDVAPATPPSCAAGAPGAGDDCGAGESCCASTLVPCGTFQPSYDGDTFNFPTPPATVSDYRLDRFEITVGRFRAFVEAGGGTQQSPPAVAAGTHPHILGSGWNLAWNESLAPTTADLIDRLHCNNVHATWTDAPGPNEGLPMNCISWFEAFAFCIWDGGRLPTEMEWNYAAAAGDEQRPYPWGSGIDDTRALYGCLQGNCPADTILPVGSKSPAGDGRWSHADLAGSMAEWTLDWFSQTYPETCVDCASVLSGTERVQRGGGFVNPPDLLLASYRAKAPPIVGDVAGRYRQVGARCARDP